MAGPGGGPPRRSHRKSRKGCDTCKRRHIRCDETFPQCRNCTKHNCRCEYMDQPATEDSSVTPVAPELLMTPLIMNALNSWRETGTAPFPGFETTPPAYWKQFQIVDLRLIHHLAGLSEDIRSRGYTNFTIWAAKMPVLLTIAVSHSFVMSSILALSASHLAWMTNNADTSHLAYHHRGVALRGLHEAIGSFSRESSEAILAASILLSWQATEWRDWASLQQGVSTVLNAMAPWLQQIELGRYLENQRASRGATTPVIPPNPRPTSQAFAEDLSRLDSAIVQLHNLRMRVGDDHASRLTGLMEFVQELRRDFPIQAPEEAFERLQKLRLWLFWLPSALLRHDESDLGAIAVLSHFFSISLVLEPLFPEIGGSYFGSMAIGPINEMRTCLLTRQAENPRDSGLQVALSLTEFPYHTVAAYRARQRYLSQHSDQYRFSAHAIVPSNFTLPSSPVPSETRIAYHEGSIGSPGGNLTVPVPSPHIPSGHASRRASWLSQASHLSSSSNYDFGDTSEPFNPQTPDPGPFDPFAGYGPWYGPRPSMHSQPSFLEASSPAELWI